MVQLCWTVLIGWNLMAYGMEEIWLVDSWIDKLCFSDRRIVTRFDMSWEKPRPERCYYWLFLRNCFFLPKDGPPPNLHGAPVAGPKEGFTPTTLVFTGLIEIWKTYWRFWYQKRSNWSRLTHTIIFFTSRLKTDEPLSTLFTSFFFQANAI